MRYVTSAFRLVGPIGCLGVARLRAAAVVPTVLVIGLILAGETTIPPIQAAEVLTWTVQDTDAGSSDVRSSSTEIHIHCPVSVVPKQAAPAKTIRRTDWAPGPEQPADINPVEDRSKSDRLVLEVPAADALPKPATAVVRGGWSPPGRLSASSAVEVASYNALRVGEAKRRLMLGAVRPGPYVAKAERASTPATEIRLKLLSEPASTTKSTARADCRNLLRQSRPNHWLESGAAKPLPSVGWTGAGVGSRLHISGPVEPTLGRAAGENKVLPAQATELNLKASPSPIPRMPRSVLEVVPDNTLRIAGLARPDTAPRLGPWCDR